MLRNLTIEGLGVFIWVYCSLSMYRIHSIKRLDNSLSLAQGMVDFFVVLAFYSIGAKVSGSHLNPVISVGHFLLGDLALSELIGYCVAQIFGGILGMVIYLPIHPKNDKSFWPVEPVKGGLISLLPRGAVNGVPGCYGPQGHQDPVPS
jgi:glycerol uptake facilitator-like aquaporin